MLLLTQNKKEMVKGWGLLDVKRDSIHVEASAEHQGLAKLKGLLADDVETAKMV